MTVGAPLLSAPLAGVSGQEPQPPFPRPAGPSHPATANLIAVEVLLSHPALEWAVYLKLSAAARTLRQRADHQQGLSHQAQRTAEAEWYRAAAQHGEYSDSTISEASEDEREQDR